MNSRQRILDYPSAVLRQRIGDALPLYGIEAMCSAAGTLVSIGTSFYMKDRFGWGMRQNFTLAAAQGIAYVPGALLAGRLTEVLGRRGALAAAYLTLTVLSLVAWRMAGGGESASASAVGAVLVAYTFVIGTSWPILESLVASGDTGGMARRLATYNVVWPAAGAVAIAVEGTILKYWEHGLFLLPATMHLLALALVFLGVNRVCASAGNMNSASAHSHVVEPELIRKRKLALWMSRTALPATYTVIYGLMPLMPFLAVMKDLGKSSQTAVASVWLFARWFAFIVLALGTWWHTRPRLLLWAAVAMLIAFFGMTLPPTHGRNPTVDLASMIAWQAVLGGALGIIYSASLYFGMVLSEGSTEHGGYHEALIGLGWVLGPGVGAIAERAKPGEAWVGVAAVGAVIAASVLVVVTTAVVMGRGRAETTDR
jgi:MFS family permease